MALDRMIYFRASPPPSFQMVSEAASFYVGGSGTITRDDPRVFITIDGLSFDPLHRTERFVEVYVHDYVDVITRDADAFTGAIADGFAALIERTFGGRRDG